MAANAPIYANSQIHITNAEDKQKMQEALDAFMADDGAWAKLLAAKTNLSTLVQTTSSTAKSSWLNESSEPMKSHRPNLSAKESLDMMIGHTGLNGEFGNSIASVIDGYLGPDKIIDPSLTTHDRLNIVQRSFQAPSQLSVDDKTGLAARSGALQKDASGAITCCESKIEALWRCADTIEQWTHVNQAALTPEQQATLQKSLADYRKALPPVLTFIEQTRQFIAQGYQGRVEMNDHKIAHA